MNQKQGVLLVLATAVISGFSIFLNTFSVSSIEPSVFTFLKNLVVAVFLASILLLTKETKALKQLSRKQWSQLAAIGFVGGSVPFLLFFNGLAMTSAAMGAFIHKTLFIYVSVFAFFLLKEKLNKKIFAAAFLLLVGNLLLLQVRTFSFGMGELLILVATLFWAFENVLSKHALNELSGNVVAFGRMFFGSLFILVYLAFTDKLFILASLSGSAVLWTLFTSVLLLLFVITYYNGLKWVKVSTAASILLLGSPVTTLLSFAFGDASVAAPQVVGILLILAGVALAVFFVEFFPKPVMLSRPHSRNGS